MTAKLFFFWGGEGIGKSKRTTFVTAKLCPNVAYKNSRKKCKVLDGVKIN